MRGDNKQMTQAKVLFQCFVGFQRRRREIWQSWKLRLAKQSTNNLGAQTGNELSALIKIIIVSNDDKH
jgi:hypothetical protein